MFYRDFMQKYRPLYAPDGVDGGATNGAAGSTTSGASSEASVPVPADAPQLAASSPPAPTDTAAATDTAASDSAPTLLEAAAGKPKPDAAVADSADGKKEEPAPTDAAKPDAKDAKPEGDKPKEEATADKKDEAAKADPDAKEATAAEPPAPIKYEAFKLPDGIKLDDKELTKFTEFAGNAQIPQDVAQGLVDLYVAERQNDAALARAEQRKTWDTLNDTWKTDLRNDPELGGNRLETSLSMAKAVIEEYLPAGEQGEYLAHLKNNGMGNFKLHVKLLRNIGKALNIFEDGIVPANPQAPKGTKGPGQRGWYPTMNGQPPG
jgi:hypothetical protein